MLRCDVQIGVEILYWYFKEMSKKEYKMQVEVVGRKLGNELREASKGNGHCDTINTTKITIQDKVLIVFQFDTKNWF